MRELKRVLRIPIAVKLSPFFTAFANVAHRLDEAGADALVLFNRFYQPDIDIRTSKATPHLELSTNTELLLRLRWLAILHGRVRPSLAVTGGIGEPNDGIKAILAGADAVQIVSALLRHGPHYTQTTLGGAGTRAMDGMERAHASRRDARAGQPGAHVRSRRVRARELHTGPSQLDLSHRRNRSKPRSRISRTFLASMTGVNGFWMKASAGPLAVRSASISSL